MGNYKLETDVELKNIKALIPDVLPTDLTECLKIFEQIEYKSFGAGMVFLYYDYSHEYWSVAFRNAGNFSNPNIKASTPVDALHDMLNYLKNLDVC